MAEDRGEDLMGYDAMAQEALRGVIKAALRRASQPGGLPGGHHLYISFKTRAAGVSAPPDLIERYPDEMTIVLQHQFWDLAPGETFFAITLRFGGQPKRLSVPYAAVTRFYDPSVQFLLQFETEAVASTSSEIVPMRPRPVEAGAKSDQDLEAAPDTAAAAAPPTEPQKSEPAAPADAGPKEGVSKEAGPKIVSLDQFRKK